MAEAPPVEPEPAGAAAAVPPPVIEQSPPVTSPEVGTDSEAGGKGKFHPLVIDNNFRSNGFSMFLMDLQIHTTFEHFCHSFMFLTDIQNSEIVITFFGLCISFATLLVLFGYGLFLTRLAFSIY